MFATFFLKSFAFHFRDNKAIGKKSYYTEGSRNIESYGLL